MALKKRKRVLPSGAAAKANKVARKKKTEAAAEAEADVNVDSGDEASSDEEKAAKPKSDGEDEELFESPDEKRVRLAKEYLGRLGGDEDKPSGEVQQQLARDVEDQAKRTRVQVEDVVLGEPHLHQNGHRLPVTCVCLSSDDSTAYTGGKDCAVVRWDVETGKKAIFPGGRNRFDCGGHFEQVLGVCLVEPRQLLVSVGVDRLIRFWDSRAPHKSTCNEALQGHNNTVTGVVADEDGSQLYTASLDKSLKIWDLRTKRCVDTLFGHVSGVVSMDMYNKGKPVTGGADKTLRLWKIDKESHLMFNRHSQSVDAVTVSDQDRFLSGGQDGNIFLWSHASKKPLASVSLGPQSWISSLRAVRRGNVVFGGTQEGQLHCWRFGRGEGDDKALKFTEVMAPLSTPGCINAIAVGRKVVACAIGKEHRLGRWHTDKQQKNGLLLMPLSYREG